MIMKAVLFIVTTFGIVFQECSAGKNLMSVFGKQSKMDKFKSDDKDLMESIELYRNMFYPHGKEEFLNQKHILMNEDNEPRLRAAKVPLAWFPSDCSTMKLNLSFVKILQDGNRNHVSLLKDNTTGVEYVWKLYNNPQEYSIELSVFTICDHPNLVKAICVQGKDGKAGILMEFVKGLPAPAFTKKNKTNEDLIVKSMAGMYDALKYMHWLGFLHADFKPENVIVKEDGHSVIIDFGFTISADNPRFAGGTPSTNSPEVVRLTSDPLLESLDWWSLATSMAQLWGIVEQMPSMNFERAGEKHKGQRWVPLRIHKRDGYIFGEVPSLTWPASLRQLLYYCMSVDARPRQFTTVKQLRWFESLAFWRGIDFQKMEMEWHHVDNISKQ